MVPFDRVEGMLLGPGHRRLTRNTTEGQLPHRRDSIRDYQLNQIHMLTRSCGRPRRGATV